ncbi:MAG: cytochrome c biogenesis heme-transporting ATPase CcmA [Chromatiales bacterium]|nr:cytochrome c biogenesis heme-transporting ATPase CcmA [Gammaproteobacteria bacterium]MCP5352313.1 cytochrome c biogenesis heme-transporting ATPase CcmA [Chromatiales bacterium]
MRLEVRDLAVERGDRLLFSGLDFALDDGEVLQIEGHNGSGKTTLLRVLCGLGVPSEGEVLWNGRPINRVRGDYFVDLNYVGHAHGVKGELTALENLGVDRALGRAHPNMDGETALDELAMGNYEDAFGRTLSAGQRRRVALARLFAKQARLWVLDEPFTALDRKTRADLEALIHRHVSGGGMVIVTTHHEMALHECVVKNLTLGL